MAASKFSGKISCFYETRVFTPQNVHDNHRYSSLKAPAATPIAATAAAAPGKSSSFSSASVVFKVLCFLRLSVAGGNPPNEFLEEKNWRKKRQSSLDLPCSSDRLSIDDNDLKISETLTLLRVPKTSHQSIIDKFRQGIASSPGSAPMIVVEIQEVTHVTLPLINEEGKRFIEESRQDDSSDDDSSDDRAREGNEESIEEGEEAEDEEVAKGIASLKKLILDQEAIDEVGHHDDDDDEVAMIKDWFSDFIHAVVKVACPVPEDMKADEEWTCPICVEVLGLEEAWSEMRCCSRLFHSQCISTWVQRGNKCPWCRSSLPLVPQSARGLIWRHVSEDFTCPIHRGFCGYLVRLWYLLAERSMWKEKSHPVNCECSVCDFVRALGMN